MPVFGATVGWKQMIDNHPIRCDSEPLMGSPIAYFLTWVTYGTWLPGDQRGWIEYGRGWKLPDAQLERLCAQRLTENACQMSATEQRNVATQIAETCQHRGWVLHAANCRSNHVHAVISALNVRPNKVRNDIKAWCSRRLNASSTRGRKRWWAQRGSIRWVWNEDALNQVVLYVMNAQDRKHRDYNSQPDA